MAKKNSVGKDKKIDLIAGNISQNILQVYRGESVQVREKLGENVAMYALQEEIVGMLLFSSGWDAALYASGLEFGKASASYMLLCADIQKAIKEFDDVNDLEDARDSKLIDLWISLFEVKKVGIWTLTHYDNEKMIFKVDECAFSCNLPDVGKKICYFNTGYLAGLATVMLDEKYEAYESKCCANGDDFCEIVLEVGENV